MIKDASGKAKYHLQGKYTQSLELKNLQTGEVREIWTAPPIPEDAQKMFGMNSFALQLNYATE